MMVSVATAVLPVWRSPMISSRWPRPIGIMASIAFSPVCSGSCTDLRATMPGALISTLRSSAPLIAPLPSIGCPSALTTRPTSPSPTGTDAILPVRLTTSFSRIFSYSPRSATPTLSSSRLSTMPRTSCGNSSSSPAIAPARPYTRAMPSPTVSTVPVSTTVTFWSYSSICLRMICEISSALMSISVLGLGRLFGEQLLAQLEELRAHAAVVHDVAELRDQPADDGRVLALVEQHGLARLALERRLEPRLQHRIERPHGGHRRAHAPGVLVDQRAVRARDVGQRADASLVEQQHDEVAHRLRQREPARHVLEHQAALLEREHRILQRHAQLGRARERLGGAIQLLAERVVGLLLNAERQERLGVAAGERAGDHEGVPLFKAVVFSRSVT